MPALTDLPRIIGFFSYSREDDRDSDGALSTLRRRIQNELRGQLGRSEDTLKLWQDAEAIPAGALWESQIEGAIEQCVFFIPIITPRVINSKYCQIEFERFLGREKALGRSDLVFPIVYIDVPQLKSENQWRDHPVLGLIGVRQYVDWSDFRFDLKSPDVGRAIAAFCKNVAAALALKTRDLAAEQRAVREQEARDAERLAQERADERRRREQQASRDAAVEGDATSKPEAKTVAKPGTKIAAVCVWIVSAALALLAFTAFGPSASEVQACIQAGGSGSGCAGAHFPAPVFWVLAILGAGYGGTLWLGRK